MLLLDRSQEIIRRSVSCQRDANFKVTPVNHSRSAEWREIGAWGVSGEVDLNRIPAPYEAYVDLSWTSLLPIISGDYECQKRPGPLGWALLVRCSPARSGDDLGKLAGDEFEVWHAWLTFRSVDS